MHRYHLSCQRHPPRYAYAGRRAWPLPGGAGCSGIHHQLLVDRTSARSNHGSPPSVVAKTRLPPSARASRPRYRSSPGPQLKVLVVPARPASLRTPPVKLLPLPVPTLRTSKVMLRMILSLRYQQVEPIAVCTPTTTRAASGGACARPCGAPAEMRVSSFGPSWVLDY